MADFKIYKTFIGFIYLTLLTQFAYGEYNVNAYCTLVKDGTKLGSIDNCQTYYTCGDGVGVPDECGSTQAFDKNSQTCKAASTVDCYYGVDNPCAGKDKDYAPVVGTCNGWIYCVNGAEKGRGVCGDGLIFSNGACTYGTCNGNVNDGTNNDLTSVCQIMPNNMYFGSTIDCETWQKCSPTELKTGKCPTDFVFNVQGGNCDYDNGNMCSRVTGENIQPEEGATRQCNAIDADKYDADTNNCSIYYICNGVNWISNQCDTGLYYDIEKETCLSRQKAKPSPTCDRCLGSKKQFVNRVDADCRQYLICKNGVKSGSNTCAVGSYFDEAAQACIGDTTDLTDYKNDNGACNDNGGNGNTCIEANDVCTCDPLSPTCNCGYDASGACTECDKGVDGQNKCIDCASVCGGQTSPDCTTDGLCECVDVGGVCTEPIPICDLSNNECKCADGRADCKCGMDGTDCIECPDVVINGACYSCTVDCTETLQEQCEACPCTWDGTECAEV